MSIANIVREARRRSGMTQAELAERAGVPKSTVGRIESGARVPSIDVVPERTNENLNVWPRRSAAWALAFDCSAQFFRNLPPDAIVNMTTNAGDLDVAFCPSGTSGFSDLKRDAIDIEAADRLHIPVASLADVVRSKEAAGREKDRPPLRFEALLRSHAWMCTNASMTVSRRTSGSLLQPGRRA